MALSQISAFLNAVPTNTEPQWVLTENGMEQAEIWSGWRKSWEGENEWESSQHPQGKTLGYTALVSENKGGSYHREKWRRAPKPRHESFRGPSIWEEYWGDMQKVCRKGWINPTSPSPNAEPVWSTEKQSAQLSSYQKTK